MPNSLPPLLQLPAHPGPGVVMVSGAWRAHPLAKNMAAIKTCLRGWSTAQLANLEWDLRGISELDHIGAQMLWLTWGHTRPAKLQLHPQQAGLFERLANVPSAPAPPNTHFNLNWLVGLGGKVLGFFQHLLAGLTLLGQLSLDFLHLLRAPQAGPWKEISANIYRTGYQALGITALVGMLIGIVLSYLSSQQLRNFGADTLLVNMLGISIIRELGPMLAAILVAGRSGSAITAQLGVMRVTEELDAMLVMGISHGFRLLLPKVLALAIAMPLLVIWTDAAALFGGMLAAWLELGMTPEFFVQKLREVVPLVNYWIGLAKGVVFGILVALVACHFGMRIKPNTESLGHGTTASVVTSITIVILADAIFAVMFRGRGILF